MENAFSKKHGSANDVCEGQTRYPGDAETVLRLPVIMLMRCSALRLVLGFLRKYYPYVVVFTFRLPSRKKIKTVPGHAVFCLPRDVGRQ